MFSGNILEKKNQAIGYMTLYRRCLLRCFANNNYKKKDVATFHPTSSSNLTSKANVFPHICIIWFGPAD